MSGNATGVDVNTREVLAHEGYLSDGWDGGGGVSLAPPHLNVIDGEEVREARVEARRLEKQRSMHHTKEVKERNIRVFFSRTQHYLLTTAPH